MSLIQKSYLPQSTKSFHNKWCFVRRNTQICIGFLKIAQNQAENQWRSSLVNWSSFFIKTNALLPKSTLSEKLNIYKYQNNMALLEFNYDFKVDDNDESAHEGLFPA